MWPILAATIAAVLLVPLSIWLIGERGRLLRSSTRRVIREYGWRWWRGLHLYVYARWPKQYVFIVIHQVLKRLSPRSGKLAAEHYHGKILTSDHARSLITVGREIPLRDLEQVVPYATARNLLLQWPLDVAVLDCACRAARATPCLPTQVCMVVGQPFVDFIVEHHPKVSRRLTQSEALDLLEAEHQRGHVHIAWFKDACLDRFYAICNCCKCCCGGIEAMVRYGIPAVASSGHVAQVDADCCSGCGECETACPFGAIEVNGQAVVNSEACMGCGVCEGQCSAAAMSLVRDPRKGTPLDVRMLGDAQAAGTE
jgi:ferredoxin